MQKLLNYSGSLHNRCRDHLSTRTSAESIQLIYSRRALRALSDEARQFQWQPIFWRDSYKWPRIVTVAGVWEKEAWNCHMLRLSKYYVVSKKLFWHRIGIVRVVSHEVWLDKGFVIWYSSLLFCIDCVVVITEYLNSNHYQYQWIGKPNKTLQSNALGLALNLHYVNI